MFHSITSSFPRKQLLSPLCGCPANSYSPAGPSSNVLVTEQLSLHSLGQRSVHFCLSDTGVSELWLVLHVSVSLVDWRLPVSCIAVAQPRA